MSIKLSSKQEIPLKTQNIAKASFPNGNRYMILRDNLGTIFIDEQFRDLFALRGQPGIAPWRLALVTILQFGENLSDRQAAEAVRGRIDWKYLLGLPIDDPGFDYSVLSEFRGRLLEAEAENRLLTIFLERCSELNIIKAKGKQRTDSTHVLAAIRTMNRLELVGETMRSALNFLAKVEPEWLKGIAEPEWSRRYGHRVENSRLPKSDAGKQSYAIAVGTDGFKLLDALFDNPMMASHLEAASIKALITAWERHYSRDENMDQIHFKSNKEVAVCEKKIESPYDLDARFRTKRDITWTGYMVHFTETCDDEAQINIITHVRTTPADQHDIHSTSIIHEDLNKLNLTPKTHLVDTAYINLDVLVSSKEKYNIDIIGPPKEGPTWRAKIEGGYTMDKFTINWDEKTVTCPENKTSTSWFLTTRDDYRGIISRFSANTCKDCLSRNLCIKPKATQGRQVVFPEKEQHAAREILVEKLKTEAGKKLYGKRAGVEGTVAQGIKNGLRRSRYKNHRKTHLQEVAGAVAMNFYRFAAWVNEIPLAKTRKSSFEILMPVAA